jgi:excisionase family DNA binding protein
MDNARLKSFEELPTNLTIKEAASWAQVTPGSVYRWVNTGLLRGTYFGGALRIARHDLEIFIASSGGK